MGNSNDKLQRVKILHWLRNNMCLSFLEEGRRFVYISEHIWQPLQPFGQEKSPSNTISTWAFVIPVPQAKNIRHHGREERPKEQACARLCTLQSHLCDSVLQRPQLVWAMSPARSLWPVTVPFCPLPDPLLCFVFSPFLPPENTLRFS